MALPTFESNSLFLFQCAVLTLSFFNQLEQSSGSNILFFHSFVTSSHRTAIWPLAEKLADRGHNVTYIFPVTKRIGSHPKVEEIIPSKMVSILSGFVSDFDINIRLNNKELEWIEQVMPLCFKLCKAFYDSPEVKEWLERPGLHFDLIMIDASFGECGYGLVHKFKAKLVLFTPIIAPFMYDGYGIVPESSSIPEILFRIKPTDMTFFNRVLSTIVPLVWRYKYVEYMNELGPVVKKGLNVTELPKLTDIAANASLVMVNTHIIEEYPMSLPPMMVSMSGLWCSKEKRRAGNPLPNEIAKFIEKSDGFFYVSFGSATVASAMPITMRNQFFNAFRAFPRHTFLWRWTGPIPEDTPDNVLLLPWFPQHDVLAHPKITGFMTQVGRPSTQEALCHGVPLIAVPIFADQDYNAIRLEYVGGAILLNINNMSETSLINSFKELLENPKYKNRMNELSEAFKDRPVDPLENVVYWTEYVLRRDTSLLRPLGIHQTWWQRRLLDVYALLFFIVSIITITGFFVFKFCVNFVLRSLRRKLKND